MRRFLSKTVVSCDSISNSFGVRLKSSPVVATVTFERFGHSGFRVGSFVGETE